MSKFVEDLKKLCDDLEKLPLSKTAEPALVVIDLHDVAKDVLTPEAAAALDMARKTTLDAWTTFEGEVVTQHVSRAVFLSTIVPGTGEALPSDEYIRTAARALYEVVNQMAKDGVLCGHLAKVSKLTLPKLGNANPRVAVFCFPHVLDPQAGTYPGPAPERKRYPYETDEGAVGQTFCVPEVPCFKVECPKCEGGPGGT